MATLTTDQATITERPPAVAEEVLRSRKGDMPWEIHDGELIEMSPSGLPHADVIVYFAFILYEYCRKKKGLKAVADGAGFLVSENPDTLLSPDAAIYRVRKPKPKSFGRFAPELAVEVRSPGDSLREMRRKAGTYLHAGSEQVWIVDPQRKVLEVRFSDGRTIEARDGIYTATGIAEGLKVDLREVFKDVDEE